MATFNDLKDTETNEHWKHIYETIASHEKSADSTQDGADAIVLDTGDLALIRDEMYAEIKDSLGANVQSADEMRARLLSELPQKLQARFQEQEALRMRPKGKGIVEDGYYNPVSGIGTSIDPGITTQATVPVSLSPTEATAYYASGGISARIIDKKSGCLSLDGIKFECDKLSEDDLARLEDYANKTGFSEAYGEGIKQSLIYGGAFVYPALKGDNPVLTQRGMKEILEQIPFDKDFIKYWITGDRWNCVFVPDYTLTAQDYLYAKSIFIPLGGVRVNTERVAMIRPKKQPFWSAIQQMGWSVSDFEGWVKDFESYAIMKASLPIMAQQMSLMYHEIPADGLIIENGPEFARQYFKENEAQMREWSMLHPKAINSVGEIKILERTYTGFQQLIAEARLALCSSSSVPESILFAEKASGLASDNRDDVTLKQSETIRLLFNNVAPAFKPSIELLVYSCFGKNSDQAKYAKDVRIKADDGIILSDQDKAQLGQSFTTIIGQMVSVGVPMGTAVNVAQKFVPSADLDQKTLEQLSSGSDEAEGMDQGLWDSFNQNREVNPNEGV